MVDNTVNSTVVKRGLWSHRLTFRVLLLITFPSGRDTHDGVGSPSTVRPVWFIYLDIKNTKLSKNGSGNPLEVRPSSPFVDDVISVRTSVGKNI